MTGPSEHRPRDGDATGVPAGGDVDRDRTEPLGRPGLQHWRESTITRPGLDDRGNVFFAAVEMTRMPMILTDPAQPDNPIAFANKAFLDLTGYEETEVLGRNCRFLQGAQTDRAAVAELRAAVARRQAIAIELLNYRRDGSPFWNAVFIGPVYDTAGTLLYFFASQLDVSRRRDAEQSHRQAQKMEAIGQLTAGLAHDFNNLLQVVNGNLELLDAGASDDRQRRYVGRARAAAERAARLTRQLLAFARKTRLDARPTDVAALLGEFSSLIAGALGGAVALALDLDTTLPAADLDPDQFEMALLNVLVNARDAMPGGGTVTIATRAETRDGRDYLGVAVADTGEGMSAVVRERATEPFFTTKGVGKGTGLGLATASGFLQQSRGRLEIESVEGAGTTVRMLFPIAAATAARADPAPAAAPATVHGDERILVVEDAPEVLALAQEILSDAGYAVTVAESGEAGLAAWDAADGGFDLLFTDLVMPGGINGMMLADALRERDPSLAVLMTTGYNEELVAQGPRQHGADVIGKPYRSAELLDRVRQALDRRGETGPRRTPSDFGAVEA